MKKFLLAPLLGVLLSACIPVDIGTAIHVTRTTTTTEPRICWIPEGCGHHHWHWSHR